MIDFPFAFGGPCFKGDLRVGAADFFVNELLNFEPTGAGEHLWLWIEKSGQNTQWVCRQLATKLGVKARDVSFSGLKDRHAVTRQWISLPWPIKKELPAEVNIEGVTVLTMSRHDRKLKRGTHKFNEFNITLRNIEKLKAAEPLLEQIKAASGVPNYFGEQRFGYDNLERVNEWFLQGKTPQDKERSFLLSAARSWLFNLNLAKRIADDSWLTPIDGEWLILNGSQSGFPFDAQDEAIAQRLIECDIHCSGMLAGAGDSLSSAACLALEQQATIEYHAWIEKLAELGLKNQRRGLRMPVYDFAMTESDDSLTFSFRLPSGCFATSVLRELVDYDDVSRQ